MSLRRSIRTAIAGTIAVTAKSVFEIKKNWPGLFEILVSLQGHQDPYLRVACYDLLAQLAENIPAHLKPHTETIHGMCMAGIADSNRDAAVAAMIAAKAHMSAICDCAEVTIMKPILPAILQLLMQTLESDEQVVADGLEVFQQAVEIEQPIVNDLISELVEFCVKIVSTKEYEDQVKNSAGYTLQVTVQNRPKLIAKRGLVRPVLEAMVMIIANTDGSSAGDLFSAHRGASADDGDDESYGEEDDAHNTAQTTIDQMALSIPQKYFVAPALEVCSSCMTSSEASMRKAGAAVLGIIAEGCVESLREILGDIVPTVLSCMQDKNYFVREASGFALGQLCEHCSPEITHYHQPILQSLVQLMGDEKSSVRTVGCYALQNCVTELNADQIRPILPDLLGRLNDNIHHGSMDAKTMALTALASLCVSAGEDYVPLIQPTVEMLRGLMFVTDENMLDLRGRALECLGHVAVAVGREHFAPYLQMGMESALSGIEVNAEMLQEFAYVFIANVARLMGPEFVPHLDNLVPPLIAVLEVSDFTTLEENDAAAFAQDDEDEEEDAVYVNASA